MKSIRILISAASAFCLAQTAAGFTIAFNTPSDYDNNFREYANPAHVTWVSANGGSLEKGTINSATTVFYNTTATGGTAGSGGTGVGTANNNTYSNFRISMDFSPESYGTGGNSIGFFTKVNSAVTAGYAAIFRITATGAADFRLWDSNTNPGTGALGTLLTSDPQVISGIAPNSFTLGTFYTFRLDVEDIGGNVRFIASIFTQGGGTQIGNSFTVTDTTSPVLGAGQVGLRLGSNSATANYYDNFTVDPIPEPATALLGLSGMALLLRRQRRQD